MKKTIRIKEVLKKHNELIKKLKSIPSEDKENLKPSAK